MLTRLLLLSLLMSCAACSTMQQPALVPWLIGDWQSEDGKITETWQSVSPNTLEGIGITRKSNREITEFMRLLRMKEQLYFIAKVSHNEFPVAFKLNEESTANRLVFVNSTHDFPKRIVYQRDGERGLLVLVSDGGGKGFEIRFLRR
ncbi:MAG: hypothetical protein HKM98_00170 [Gammaproteobacteria bacterium]|nr:hypothetical protein [Gammaproteobacteria bacterium]